MRLTGAVLKIQVQLWHMIPVNKIKGHGYI